MDLEGPTRPRLVIADDDPDILHVVARLLESRFEIVGRATNGRELVKAVRKLSPAVVVTDITMPELNGIEATRLIRKNCRGVRVVALSVHDDPAIIEAAFEAGAAGYVSKTAAHTDLIPTIEKALNGDLHALPRRR